MTSQITSLTIVHSNVYSGADQRKHQSSASLAFVRGIHRWPVNSLHKWAVNVSNAENVPIWWRHHDLNQLWISLMTHICVTRPHWVKCKCEWQLYCCVLYLPPPWYFPCSHMFVIFAYRLTSPLWWWVPFAVEYIEIPLSKIRGWLVIRITPNIAMAKMIHTRPQLPYRDISPLPWHCNKPH